MNHQPIAHFVCDDERVETLKSYQLLDTNEERSFDDLVALASAICGTPMAAVSLVDRERQWFKSRIGIGVRQTPREWAFCNQAIQSGHYFEVRNASLHPKFCDNPLVVGDPNIRFYAGAPLIDSSGAVLGTLCVLDRQPRTEGLSEEQRLNLDTLAFQVLGQMERHRANMQATRLQSHLDERDRELASLLDNLPGIVYKCSLQSPWQMSFVSDYVRAITGYGSDDFMSGRIFWASIVDKEDLSGAAGAIADAVQHRQPYDMTYRIHRADGAVRWVRETGNAIFADDGSSSCIEGYICDCTEVRQAESALKSSESRMATVLNNATVGIMHRDITGKLLLVNDRYCELLGRTRDEIDGKPLDDLTHPDDLEESRRLLAQIRKNGEPYTVKKRYIRPDGSSKWCEATISYVPGTEGVTDTMIAIAKDIDVEIAAEKAVKEREERLSLAVDAAMMGILDVDITTGQHSWSPLLQNLIGAPAGAEPSLRLFYRQLAPGELGRIRRRRRALKARYDGTEIAKDGFRFTDTLRLFRADTGDIRWLSCDGRWMPSDAPQGRLILSFRDVTVEMEANERISWIANHDSLTSLANRRSFSHFLETRLSERALTAEPFAVILFDLDNFKEINDTMGHPAGDAVLTAVAERVGMLVDETDLVARLGGDEFGLICSCDMTGQSAISLCRRIIDCLTAPVEIDQDRQVDVRASVGMSLFPRHGSDTHSLLKSADLALYAAKRSGKGAFRVFDTGMSDELDRHSFMIRNAKSAIRNDSILPYYQPKYSLIDGSLVGLEALLRWRDEAGEIRSPDCVAAAFEDTEISTTITDIMLRQIAADMARWTTQGVDFGHVAVNATSADLRKGGFRERILQTLQPHDLPTSTLQIEVTENVLMDTRSGQIALTLEDLHNSGLKICLDDFGTGFASLTHLRSFPVDVIKIDRSFVAEIKSATGNHPIVDAIINISRALHLDVVAEGIETKEQERYLQVAGCNVGQGFLFSRAQSADEISLRALSTAA